MSTTTAAASTSTSATAIGTVEPNVGSLATPAPDGNGAPASKPHNLPGGVNPLDFLYKLATQRGMTPPDFKQVTEQGPAHMKTFVWHCSFNNMVAQGTGRSKKEAKIAAAKAIRDNLDYNSLPPVPNHGGAFDRKRKNKDGQPNEANGPKKRRSGGQNFPPSFGPGGFGPGYNQYMSNAFYGGGYFGGPPMPLPHPFMGPPVGPNPSGDIKSQFDEKKEGEEGNGTSEDQVEEGKFGPSREEFMNPAFGGFFNDNAAVPFDGSCPGSQLFDKERNLMVTEYQSRMARGYRSRLSKLDRHVIRKHKDIYPEERELSAILKLVTDSEESLKKVAEALNTKDCKKISGMVRVGDLSKGLLLASDRKVDLVLLCKEAPTKLLLSQVDEKVTEKFKEVVGENCQYKVNQNPFDSSLTITASSEQLEDDSSNSELFSVRVTLTSLSLSTDEKADPADQDSLPLDKCLNALSELRHSKWFAITAANLPSCVECIRIIKDLCQRDDAWKSLSSWAIELLVERALFSAWMPLNPAASLMRVMEVVASGIFMVGGPGLKDPCEKQDVDVTANLTIQEIENLTHSAQRYLRYMHFRQIFKVLGMSRDEYHDEQQAKDFKLKEEPDNPNGRDEISKVMDISRDMYHDEKQATGVKIIEEPNNPNGQDKIST